MCAVITVSRVLKSGRATGQVATIASSSRLPDWDSGGSISRKPLQNGLRVRRRMTSRQVPHRPCLQLNACRKDHEPGQHQQHGDVSAPRQRRTPFGNASMP